MIPDLFGQTSVPALEQSILFAQARHNVLAGNVANMDTPGYRVRDLSTETFQQRLKEALEARDRTGHPVSSGLMREDPSAAMRRVSDSMKDILFHDQSDVNIEKQILEISKNQGMHNMAIAILSSQFRMLETAIRERI